MFSYKRQIERVSERERERERVRLYARLAIAILLVGVWVRFCEDGGTGAEVLGLLVILSLLFYL